MNYSVETKSKSHKVPKFMFQVTDLKKKVLEISLNKDKKKF